VKELNFLPRSFVEARRRRQILRLQSLLIGAVLVALAVMFASSNAVLGRVEAESLGARRTEELLGRQMVAMQQLKRKQADLLRQQEIQRRLGNWVPRSSVLLLITRLLPQGVGLLDLTMNPKNAAADRRPELGLNERGPDVRSKGRTRGSEAGDGAVEQDVVTEVVFTGVAASDVHIARVVADMEAHKAFTNVRLVYSKHRLVDERILREFQVRCQLVEKQVEQSGD
jgi:hypothetical protein